MKIKINQPLTILIVIFSVATIILLTAFFLVFSPSSFKDIHGNRSFDEKKYKPADNIINEIKEELKKNENIEDVNYRLTIKLLNFEIKLKQEIPHVNISELLNIINNKLTEATKKHYDIQAMITCDDSKIYPLFAYKSKVKDSFTLTVKREITEEEQWKNLR